MVSFHSLTPARLAVLTLLTLLVAPATAGPAMYRCSKNSASWWSDRPCEGSGQSELRALGNTQQTPAYNPSYIAPLGKAPDHLPYLSAECAQLNDAIRTGPARGLKAGPMSELNEDYRKRCREDEQLARRRLQEVEADQREHRRADQAAAKAEKTRAVLNSEQGYEMLRILHAKRQRVASMNDGEKADLHIFEDNYKARCPRG